MLLNITYMTMIITVVLSNDVYAGFKAFQKLEFTNNCDDGDMLLNIFLVTEVPKTLS